MRRFHILIWGTGNWCGKLLGQIPTDCVIDTFIETVATRDDYLGIPVVSCDSYKKLYRNADLVIVAVENNAEIIELIREKAGSLKNVFYMENACTVARSADGRGWFGIKDLFDERIYNARQEMYTAPYIVSRTNQGMNMLVNSKNQMFLNGVLQGDASGRGYIELYQAFKKILWCFA